MSESAPSVEIKVSPATYEEIRRALVRMGSGGEIVERADDCRITMGDVILIRALSAPEWPNPPRAI